MVDTVSGTYTIGPRSGQLLAKTGRTGLGRRAGHDLTLEVTRWTGVADIDVADPGACRVELTAEVDSFVVREGTGGLKPLTDADHGRILKSIREDILGSDRHPSISFRTTAVIGHPAEFVLHGDLTIRDVTRPVEVRGALVGHQVHGQAVNSTEPVGHPPILGLLRGPETQR